MRVNIKVMRGERIKYANTCKVRPDNNTIRQVRKQKRAEQAEQLNNIRKKAEMKCCTEVKKDTQLHNR